MAGENNEIEENVEENSEVEEFLSAEHAAIDDADEYVEDDQDDQEQQAAVEVKDNPSVVPLASLLEEREKWDRKVRDMEQRLSRYDTIDQKLEEFQKLREEAEKEPEPDFDMDPTGSLKYQLERLAEENRQLKEQFSGVQTQTQQQAAVQQIGQAITASEGKFAAEHADYYDALEHVRNVERAKLKPIAEARGVTDEQLEQQIFANELQAAAQLLQLGQDPASYAYQMAQSYGYKPKGKQQEGDSLDKLEKGMRRAKSLGSGGGTKKATDLVDSSIDEFDEAMNELFGARTH